MVLPFRRRSSEEEPAPKDEDEDLEAILEAVSDAPDEDEQASFARIGACRPRPCRKALTVVTTCMDVRRNENVLIVCDPTTAEVGRPCTKRP